MFGSTVVFNFVRNGEIDFNFNFYQAAVTSARLLAWTPKDGNADELGEWFEGDIMLEEGKDRPTPLLKNGLVDEKYRWTGGVVPFEIDAGVCELIDSAVQNAGN